MPAGSLVQSRNCIARLVTGSRGRRAALKGEARAGFRDEANRSYRDVEIFRGYLRLVQKLCRPSGVEPVPGLRGEGLPEKKCHSAKTHYIGGHGRPAVPRFTF